MTQSDNVLKQFQLMQDRLATFQAQVDSITAEGESGGGLVKVEVNAKGYAKSLKIDPSLAKEEISVLEDLILTAFNDARAKSEKRLEERTQELAGGFGLPSGAMNPFGNLT